MSQTVLITGTSRGIGLALTERYLGRGATVFAAARNPDASREMWEMERDFGARVKILQLDVTDPRAIDAAAAALAGQPLDLLINNAGILHKNVPFATLSEADVRQAFDVNVLGPLRLTQRLLPSLKLAKRPVVASLSSKMGSIADNTSGGYYAYRMSKAALNMLMRSFALDHPEVTSVVLHPGWVQTEMGGAKAPLTVAASVDGLVAFLDGVGPEASGRFFDYLGQELPW